MELETLLQLEYSCHIDGKKVLLIYSTSYLVPVIKLLKYMSSFRYCRTFSLVHSKKKKKNFEFCDRSRFLVSGLGICVHMHH